MAGVCLVLAAAVLGHVTKLIMTQHTHRDNEKIAELSVIACVLAGLSVVMTALGSR